MGVNLLDKLMNLVGELVLARNQLLQYSNDAARHQSPAPPQRMNLIATELQGEVMKTRMQPDRQYLEPVSAHRPRCGARLRQGSGDRDGRQGNRTRQDHHRGYQGSAHPSGAQRGRPRNRTPEVRITAGRQGASSSPRLSRGGQVNIEIRDDGAGLNLRSHPQKAVERGVVTPEQAARLTEREIYNLIFLPGFSTAEKVTNVSGRGVGMDVVKTNVEKIGGTVDVQSAAGQGTTVRIKIPLTLAIIPA